MYYFFVVVVVALRNFIFTSAFIIKDNLFMLIFLKNDHATINALCFDWDENSQMGLMCKITNVLMKTTI